MAYYMVQRPFDGDVGTHEIIPTDRLKIGSGKIKLGLHTYYLPQHNLFLLFTKKKKEIEMLW